MNNTMEFNKVDEILLNAYAPNELLASLHLGELIRKNNDLNLRVKLSKHCYEEARHASIWYNLISKLNMPLLDTTNSKKKKSYWQYINNKEDLIEFLSALHIYELRVPFHFSIHSKFTKSQEIKNVLIDLIKEEGPHLSWIREYLKKEINKGNNLVKKNIKKFLIIERKNYIEDLEIVKKIGLEGEEFVKMILKEIENQNKFMEKVTKFE
ncbi:MAG: hypothetical protein QW727_01170 [Candidatus Pacearchaeota archaeon]